MREGVKSTSDMVRIRKVLILRGTCAIKFKKKVLMVKGIRDIKYS